MTEDAMPGAAAPVPEAVPVVEAPSDPDRRDERAGQEPGDLTLALSPRQILGGFALLAAAVVLLRRRGRAGRGSKG
jgi:hypothetical protein